MICSNSLRFMARKLPVQRPPFARTQDSAEGIGLPQSPPLLGRIKQNTSDLRPSAVKNGLPLPHNRSTRLLRPAPANRTRLIQTMPLRIGINPLHNGTGHHQAAFLDRAVVHDPYTFPLAFSLPALP